MTAELLVALVTIAWLAGVVTGNLANGTGWPPWFGWSAMMLPALAGITTTLWLVIGSMP